MHDPIFESFLRNQMATGLKLSQASDLLDLYPVPADQAWLIASPAELLEAAPTFPKHFSPPAWFYLAVFHCHGLIRVGGDIRQADRFDVAIQFQPAYLRVQPKAPEVLYWIGPSTVFHPNIRPPFICPGRLQPAMTLCDLLYQIFEIISYQKVNPREDDALNLDACVWARHHQDRLPVDTRPLKRRSLFTPVTRKTPAGPKEPLVVGKERTGP
jgi:hypothetical protein